MTVEFRWLPLMLAFTFAACAGPKGPTGATGPAGTQLLLRTAAEPAGANCATGGLKVDTGLDANGNGTLDDLEVTATAYVCDGAAGQGLVPVAEPAGANCAEGGVKLVPTSGAATYVCNGETGTDGASVVVTPEPAGANCTYGGQELQVGTGTPSYVCDGAPGVDGQSVAMTPEPAGSNCTYGGQKLQVGASTPAYVCDGAPGADGQSVTMTPEPAGANCEFSGVALKVGSGPVAYLCSGAPAGVTLPTVETDAISSSSYREAAVDGAVTADGGEMIFARGVALATHAGPTDADSVYLSGSGLGSFTTTCDGLEPGTTYYVRAFATNALGTRFGAELSFATPALASPTVTTSGVESITQSTAIVEASVLDGGGTPVLDRGICWGLAPAPALGGSCASEGPGDADFLAMATALAGATTYHVRAYATNAQGTGYGEDLTFTSAVPPLATVTTAAPSGVGFTGATGGGSVLDDAGAPVSSRGICWSTAPSPTTADSCASEGAGLGSFSSSIAGLSPGTGYHVRAFAVNSGGTSYGNDVSFATPAATVPTLTTRTVNGISSNLAGSGGDISSDGGSPVTAKGVCWSLNPNPTTANATTVDGTGSAGFNSVMTGLAPLTSYHVRAYATNAQGTGYGNDLGFTTTDLVNPGPTVPVVGTATATMSSATTASSGGYVSSDGGSTVTARGVCWSTAQNPTLADSCSADGGSGIGYFTATVTGLGGCAVLYYVRAYATNATGTAYGNQVAVSTGLLATLSTAPISNIGDTDATSGGIISDDGGCPVTARGVVWSWNPNPTTSNPKTSDGTGAGTYASAITGLYSNRSYYVRAYATNSVGTVYGDPQVFTTAEPSTPYLGESYAGGIVFYVDGTGLHGLVAAPSDQGYASWGCAGVLLGTSTDLGQGATNTAAIVAACGAGTAAQLADGLSLNGYSDWFLPSRDELSLMHANLTTVGLGGFASELYWSSSESGASSAWAVEFWDGSSSGVWQKGDSRRIRAVRAF